MDRTPEEWRNLLLLTLQTRHERHRILRAYYDGQHGMPTAPSTTTDLYRRLAQLGETNMCALVVDRINDRMTPIGVRLSNDDATDGQVWNDVWQANNLDADWPTAQEEALKVGRCPVLIWPNNPDDASEGVSITVEDPDETLVAYEPGSRRKRATAMKVYTDGVTEFCSVYTPSEVVSWTRVNPQTRIGYVPTNALYIDLAGGNDWLFDAENSGANPFGAVPVVELVCKPSVKNLPQPELSRPVLMIQDRINKTMFDTVVAAEYGAFPQRYTIGIEVQRDPVTNAPINPLTIGPNRTWNLVPSRREDGSADPSSIGQLSPFPLADLLALCDASIKQLASITSTPIYHLLAISNVGADWVRASERGHISKIRAHQTRFGEVAEELFRLALIHQGVVDPPDDIEMVWAPPESRSDAEVADAALKLSQAGWPFPAIARRFGETPSAIARMLAERAAQTPEQAAIEVMRVAATSTAPALIPAVAEPVGD